MEIGTYYFIFIVKELRVFKIWNFIIKQIEDVFIKGNSTFLKKYGKKSLSPSPSFFLIQLERILFW